MTSKSLQLKRKVEEAEHDLKVYRRVLALLGLGQAACITCGILFPTVGQGGVVFLCVMAFLALSTVMGIYLWITHRVDSGRFSYHVDNIWGTSPTKKLRKARYAYEDFLQDEADRELREWEAEERRRKGRA